jgi:prepilin-type N-terminal cleavage/methylation domain-containing protein
VRTPTSKAGTSSSRASGFTFIELTVVLLLLGVLMIFAVPRFAQVALQGSTKAAARRMYGVIATVHDKAALQKRRYWLGMELGSGEYWASASEPAEVLSPEDVLRLRDRAVLDGVLPGEVIFSDVVLEDKTLKEGTALAVFEPNGTCLAAQIHLEDDEGAATLIVNPLTGRSAVYDSYLLHQGGEQPAATEEAAEGPAEEPAAAGEQGLEQPAEEEDW